MAGVHGGLMAVAALESDCSNPHSPALRQTTNVESCLLPAGLPVPEFQHVPLRSSRAL